MADQDDNTFTKPAITDATWGFLVLRLWIGLRMFFAGAQKFYAKPDGATEFSFNWSHYKLTAEKISASISDYAFFPLNPKTFLEKVFHMQNVSPALNFEPGIGFAYALPWLLLVFGVFLIFGILPRVSLVVAGVVFTMLSIGLMALGDNDGIAYLGIHVGLVSMAILLVRHARFNTRF